MKKLQYLSKGRIVTVLGRDSFIGEYDGETYWRLRANEEEWSVRESLLVNALETCPQPPLGRGNVRLIERKGQ